MALYQFYRSSEIGQTSTGHIIYRRHSQNQHNAPLRPPIPTVIGNRWLREKKNKNKAGHRLLECKGEVLLFSSTNKT